MTKAPSKKSKANKYSKGKTKSDQVITLLSRPTGASIADMTKSTGWQTHSVRGFLAGALKKKSHKVVSEVGSDGVRRYRLEAAVAP